jgi:predicted extracellular nuclease
MSHKFLGLLALSALLGACGGGQNSSTTSALVLPSCTAQVAADAPLNNIGEIQGTTGTSAMASQKVNVRGVVVGGFQKLTDSVAQLNGFFVQQATPDSDAATSEGIFVFAPDAAKLSAGDFVQVSGTVSEFGSAGSTVTQIADTVTVSVCGSGVAIAPTPVSRPVASATDLERYEGMLVEINQPLAVTEMFELGRYGQLVLSTDTRQFQPNNGSAVATHTQNLLARIVLDDGSSQSNPAPTPYFSDSGTAGTRRMGDTVGKVIGVLSHNFGVYRVHPTIAPVLSAANARPTSAPTVNSTLKVASSNVLNYFTTLGARGANTEAEFARQKAKIVEAIAGLDADVVGLMEIENNADGAVNDLVAALNAKIGAGTYAAVNSGKFGTDQIKVDILYKPARVSRVGGVVLPTGEELTDYTAASGRPPLA